MRFPINLLLKVAAGSLSGWLPEKNKHYFSTLLHTHFGFLDDDGGTLPRMSSRAIEIGSQTALSKKENNIYVIVYIYKCTREMDGRRGRAV